jgi:hypothetical protein
MEVEDLGVGVSFTEPPQAGLMTCDSALQRSESEVAEL